MCFAAFILAGVFIELPAFYRPLNSGEATHPLTAILAIIASLQLLRLSNSKKAATLTTINTISVSIVFAAMVLLDKWLGIDFVEGLTMHVGAFEYEKSLGLETQIGVNTCLMFFFLGISHFLLLKEKTSLALGLIFVAFTLVFLSLAGYIAKQHFLHGSMSLITASLGLILIVMTLLNVLKSYNRYSPSQSRLFWFISGLILIPLFVFISILVEYDSSGRPFSFILIFTPWVCIYLSLLFYYAVDKVESTSSRVKSNREY